MVRGLSALVPNAPFIELPLNITEDRLVSSIDIECAVKEEKQAWKKDCLPLRTGLLYADEVNLLPEHIANIVLQTAGAGENVIEREGISFSTIPAYSHRFDESGKGALRSTVIRPIRAVCTGKG